MKFLPVLLTLLTLLIAPVTHAKENEKLSLTFDPVALFALAVLKPEYKAIRWGSFRVYNEKEEVSFILEPMSQMGVSISLLKHLKSYDYYALGGTISFNRIAIVENPINIEAFFRNEWTSGTTTDRRKQNVVYGLYFMPGWGWTGVIDEWKDEPKLTHGFTFRFGLILGIQFWDS